ncbi:GxxExxY protein [Spirosoma radiotolerans]|uniref:GxxExxY protein n=1 Tax=Spirosoma radiotolerans TaxID=1379870 RepID=A0A0E3ZX08_9BACT|nr:GxxExxY protein [Spirosoma radiotolerans]AKD56873.1 GxxExxY protein [Spirosoma radiotolerans]
MNSNYQHSDITQLILKSFYKVYNTLGYCFLEKVYENAMRIELRKIGLVCIAQQPIDVFYDSEKVGVYYADLIINSCVIVELKAADGLAPEHEAQLTNYLKATNIEVGLLLNFGRQPQHKRKVFTNDRKDHN